MTISKSFWTQLLAHINVTSPEDQAEFQVSSVHGGDINRAFRLRTRKSEYFVKINASSNLPCFQTEKTTLEKLSAFCPKVISVGCIDGNAFLVLEYIDMSPYGDESKLGSLIANLHANTNTEGKTYGWHEDNYIGLSPQRNTPCTQWEEFWCLRRILPQLQMAYDNGFETGLKDMESSILAAIKKQLHCHKPEPVLLHGDLWSGNKGFKKNGEPIIFDPASYFGDHEVDIAMTELFGGFGPNFYRAYYNVKPRNDGYTSRKRIYNFYHILNHLNLFGESYRSQCIRYAKMIINH